MDFSIFVTYLGSPSQIPTNWLAQDKRNVLSHRSGDWKAQITMLAGSDSLASFQEASFLTCSPSRGSCGHSNPCFCCPGAFLPMCVCVCLGLCVSEGRESDAVGISPDKAGGLALASQGGRPPCVFVLLSFISAI